MCPRFPSDNQHTSTGSPLLPPITAWAATACCTVAVFRQHSITLSELCNGCFSALNSRRQRLYSHVTRHYIVFGGDSRLEKCSSCRRVLANTVPVRDSTCGICPRVTAGFLSYIARNGETPYNVAEPTLVTISQTRI